MLYSYLFCLNYVFPNLTSLEINIYWMDRFEIWFIHGSQRMICNNYGDPKVITSQYFKWHQYLYIA